MSELIEYLNEMNSRGKIEYPIYSRLHDLASVVVDDEEKLRAENERLKSSEKKACDTLEFDRDQWRMKRDGYEASLKASAEEIERLKNLAELHRQAIEKDVSAHDRAEIQAFYDNIASKEPSLAQKANTVQVNAIARLNAEIEQLKERPETFDPIAVRELLQITDGVVVLLRVHFEYANTAGVIDEHITKVRNSERKS